MNQQQTIRVLRDLNIAGLVGAMEGQAPVWQRALADLRTEDVTTAVDRIIAHRTSRERWVTPGDVRAAVGEIHGEHADAAKPALAARIPDGVRNTGADYTWLSIAQAAMRRGATIDEAVAFATDRVVA